MSGGLENVILAVDSVPSHVASEFFNFCRRVLLMIIVSVADYSGDGIFMRCFRLFSLENGVRCPVILCLLLEPVVLHSVAIWSYVSSHLCL